jgi:hypothetical protein
MVPTSEVDADESTVNLTSDIGFVMSYVESILAMEVVVVVVMTAAVIPAMEESQGAVQSRCRIMQH